MQDLEIGQKAPEFNLPTDNDGLIKLADLKGKKVILYFYPKDNTPGCTVQACDLRDHMEDFNDLNIEIIGISKDSPASHTKFKAKHNLNFTLASDESSDTCEKYGVWKEKSMYGKKFMGIERSTFLIDEKGNIATIWKKVSPKDHVQLLKEQLA
jgi:thioredoxin-dependent peroxiredoxin